MQQEKKKLGHILIQNGILTPYTVARMLRESKHRNKRLGCMLEEFGLVTSEELAAVLAQQFNLKQVSGLANNTYSPDVLQVINVEFALEQIIFPLNMEERMLHLAIADPTDMKVIDNFAKNNGLLITPYVASRKEIYAAISRHYLGTRVKKSRKTTILVVDDDDLLRSTMKDILVKQGYNVVTATDGMEGFREVITSKPQVVVADNAMPKFDGFALLKSIKANPETCKIPVILVSDKLSDEDEAKVFEIGFFDHIPKPFKEVTLVSRINRAVSSGELAVASTAATELPWEKQEASDQPDDVFFPPLGGGMPTGTGTHSSAQPDGELERPETFIGQKMIDFPDSEPPPPVTPSALSETVPSAEEQKPGQDTAPVSLETIQSTFTTPVVTPSGRNFTAFGETTAHAEKIIEDTLLAYGQVGRSHSRIIIFMAAVALVVVAGVGYLLMDQLHLRSLCQIELLQKKIFGQTVARAGGTKASELSRPVHKPLSSASHLTAVPIQQLPSFVPVNGRDASFSTQRPGWERYVDSRRDVRVFRQSGRIKALQVIAPPGQVITEASVKSALRELTGNADFVSGSRERQGNYLLQRSRVGQRGGVLLYRKIPAEAIVAFVVSLD
jgi:CheY-like chemotaxis protein